MHRQKPAETQNAFLQRSAPAVGRRRRRVAQPPSGSCGPRRSPCVSFALRTRLTRTDCVRQDAWVRSLARRSCRGFCGSSPTRPGRDSRAMTRGGTNAWTSNDRPRCDRRCGRRCSGNLRGGRRCCASESGTPAHRMVSRAAATRHAARKGKSTAGAAAGWLTAQGSKAMTSGVECTRALVGGLWQSMQAAYRGATARQDSLGVAQRRWSARYGSEALTWALGVALAVCVGIATRRTSSPRVLHGQGWVSEPLFVARLGAFRGRHPGRHRTRIPDFSVTPDLWRNAAFRMVAKGATPRVGLEPTTLRLTAGCSAN